jgi:hypothetical protein
VNYELDVDPDARSQITALPAYALTSLADAMAMLELTPWNAALLHNPRTQQLRLRTGTFPLPRNRPGPLTTPWKARTNVATVSSPLPVG